MSTRYSRRRFLARTALTAGTLSILPEAFSSAITTTEAGLPDIHIFSKHLQFLNYADMADAAASMGFAGVDLTVRPEGHVRPERVEDDLPKAVDALKKVGLPPKLMTTAVGDATDATDLLLLQIAAKLGFQLYRMKWYAYNEKWPIPASIQGFQKQVQALGELNKRLKLTGCYQNHAGTLVGSSVWEIWEMLKTADPTYTGAQYDIRHATVEGGQSWPTGLRLIQPHIKALTMKDFIWEKKNGRWIVQDVPLGEGMIDFKSYFAFLKQTNIRVPITLHIEYPTGGAEHGATKLTSPQNEVFTVMKRDMNRLKELWQTA